MIGCVVGLFFFRMLCMYNLIIGVLVVTAFVVCSVVSSRIVMNIDIDDLLEGFFVILNYLNG